MLFAAIVPTHSVLTLSTASPIQLTLSNAALSPNATQSSLFLLSCPTNQPVLLVNLKQSTRDSYPCSLTLLLKEGLTVEFQAGPGSIHLLGSYRSAVDGEETQPNLIQMKVSPATAGFSQERSDEAESEERSNCVKSLGRMANSALAARAEEDSDAYSSDEEQPKNKQASEDSSSDSEEEKVEKAPSGKRRALKEKRMMKRGDSEDEEAQPELPKDEEQKQLVEEKPEPAKIDKMLWRKYLTKGSNNKKKVEIDEDEDDDDDDEDFDEDDEDDEDDESSSEESEEEVKPKKKVESRAKGRNAAPQPAKRRRVRESSSEESEPFQYKVPVKLPDFIKQ